MNKKLKTGLTITAATLATPLYCGWLNFKRNSNLNSRKRLLRSLFMTGLIAGSSSIVGQALDFGITKYSQSREIVREEHITTDGYDLDTIQKSSVLPTQKIYLSFMTPIAPIIEYLAGGYPIYQRTEVLSKLRNNKTEFTLLKELSGLVSILDIDTDTLKDSTITVQPRSVPYLLKECGL